MNDMQMPFGREAEARKLSLVACNTRNAVIIKDAQHRIEWVNESFKRHYGHDLDQGRGHAGQALSRHGERVAEAAAQAVAEAASGDAPRTGRRREVQRKGRDGRARWLALECRPIVDDHGAVTGYIEIENDITEHKRIEEKLQREKQAAESANHAKSAFLATICHEIRNPVNVMIGMMDLALQTTLTAEQSEYLEMMKVASGALLTVVNDTLDLAKIEAGCLKAENVRFSLRDCLGDAMKMLAFEAQKKNLVLAYDVAQELPDSLTGDPMRLRQIVLNLVSNAIKYTEVGEVVMRVDRQAGDDSRITCRFAITDTGPGIASDRQAAIFEPFQQAETSTARIYGGSGLGLHIAAQLVKLMDGRLWVDSQPGAGSTFSFTARFGCAGVRAARADPPDCSGLRALVVEDHPVSRQFIANILRQWNITVDEAASGPAALALAAQAAAERKPYRLMLIDECLRDARGCELYRRLNRGLDAATCQLVLLRSSLKRTAPAQEPEADGGMFLTMPVKQHELRDIAMSVISGMPAAASTPPRHRQYRQDRPAAVPGDGAAEQARENLAKRNLSILLVDDDPLVGKLARRTLANAGCRVQLADGGACALAMLAREQFDLVLMDMHMPGMDGAETTRVIRQRGSRIPVIALTAAAIDHDRAYAARAGMDGHLLKPVDTASLSRLIDRLSGMRGATSTPMMAEKSAETFAASAPVVDHRALLVTVGGDRGLLAEIVDMFPANCDRQMQVAAAAIASGNAPLFSETLHALLGMFRNLAAPAAEEAVARLQDVDVIDAPAQAAAGHAQLAREVERLRVALASLSKAPAVLRKFRRKVRESAGPPGSPVKPARLQCRAAWHLKSRPASWRHRAS